MGYLNSLKLGESNLSFLDLTVVSYYYIIVSAFMLLSVTPIPE